MNFFVNSPKDDFSLDCCLNAVFEGLKFKESTPHYAKSTPRYAASRGVDLA
jgi:hypothetical protein